MYAISPDGQEVAYASNIDEVEATSTNKENFHESWQRFDAALFAGRKIPGLALASSRRFRSG